MPQRRMPLLKRVIGYPSFSVRGRQSFEPMAILLYRPRNVWFHGIPLRVRSVGLASLDPKRGPPSLWLDKSREISEVLLYPNLFRLDFKRAQALANGREGVGDIGPDLGSLIGYSALGIEDGNYI